MDGWFWPQWVFAVLLAWKLTLTAILSGRARPPISFRTKIIDVAIVVALTWAGGFWS